MFEGLLLQMLIVLFPIIMYHALRKPKDNKGEDYLFSLLCFFSMILCMSFPVVIEGGIQLDLRFVPWLLSFLYGNRYVAVGQTVVMLVYRIYIGGFGIYIALGICLLVLPLIFLLLRKYRDLTYVQKQANGLGIISLNCYLVIISIYIADLGGNHLFFYFIFSLFNIIGLWFSIYLKEDIMSNEMLRRQLQRSAQLNSVGEMAASIAHEIRNPMTAARGFLQLIQSDKELDQKYHKFTSIGIAELDRAHQIIEDYLTLAKPQEENHQIHFDISEEIRSVIETMSAMSNMYGSEIKYSIMKGHSFYIKGNPKRIRQVFVNLIKNSIEATDKGGLVDIRLYEGSEYIKIEVEDNGRGIPKDMIDKLGLPFFSNKTRGTGLGLLVCYRIIDMMEGKITVKSEVDKGTRFTILLPKYYKWESNRGKRGIT
jgi:two-component system sporulation sensor kinase B